MKEGFINIKGLKIFTRITGEGDPFLILHGWGVGCSSWKTLQGKLADYFRVITLDLPGFGKSDLPPSGWNLQNYVNFLVDFLRETKTEKFYLMGHSFGGRVAIKFTVQHPEKVKTLILVDAAGIKHPKRCLKRIAAGVKIFSFLPGYKFLQKIFYRVVLKNTEYLQEEGTKKETHKKVVEENLAPLLMDIKIPTLIVWGKKDRITPLKDAYIMKREIQNAQLKILPTGHSPHREKPQLLLSSVLSFLENEDKTNN